MDFLEHNYIQHVQNEERAERRKNIISHRRGEDFMRELSDNNFKSHYRFDKNEVREIVNILDESLR